MAVRVKKKSVQSNPDVLVLPTEPSAHIADPWAYAYLLTGEKKIGKTKFATTGVDALVLQFDKPQIAYQLMEVLCSSWAIFKKALAAIEEKAKDPETFPWDRVVVDGAGEWFTMCQLFTCKHFGVEHPSEEGYARAWHYLRDEFTSAVNRLMRLQATAQCGLIFIAHSEWKTKKTRGGGEVERIVPNLPPRCEEILNGKCDGWFMMDYMGEDRVMVLQGDEYTGAGHRIDGHFMTPSGERVREVPMGGSSEEAVANFVAAFQNKQLHATARELRRADKEVTAVPRRIVRKK